MTKSTQGKMYFYVSKDNSVQGRLSDQLPILVHKKSSKNEINALNNVKTH